MELNHWLDNAWADGAWVQNSWGAIPCDPAPIGTVWESGSWVDTAWCSGTWEGVITPPIIPVVTFGPPRRVKPRFEWKKKEIEEEIPAELLPPAFVEKLERILPPPPAEVKPLEEFYVNLTPIFPIPVKSQSEILASLDAEYQKELSAIMKKKQLNDLLDALQEKYQKRIAAELEEKRRMEDEEIFVLFS